MDFTGKVALITGGGGGLCAEPRSYRELQTVHTNTGNKSNGCA